MALRIGISLLLLVLLAGGSLLAQHRVRTETIRPGPPPAPLAVAPPAQKFEAEGHIVPPGQTTEPQVQTDLSALPAAVADMRERIVAAARSGELEKLAALMETTGGSPIYSYADHDDPVAFWRANYPDSAGVEILAILLTILDVGFVHVDVGTPQEIYLWPYFARRSLTTLSPQQRVELFRIVTGHDYKQMIEFGAYSFYRLGIAPDGTWHFFVSGD
jgi:hypothetical protein